MPCGPWRTSRGRGVATVAIGDPERMHADGAAAARAAGTRMIAWDDPDVGASITAADLVLDGILGIGGAGAVREPAAGAVRAVLASGVPVVAVDVPSGVDSDTGEVAGLAMRADVTVCFGVLKPALVVPPARSLAGSVTVVDIGLRARDLEPAAWALSLADLAVAGPAPDAHKYSRGVVGVTAGSLSYPGAALLAVGGARMSGVGMVAFSPGPPGRAPRGRARTHSAAADGDPGELDPVAAMVVARYPDVVLAPAGRWMPAASAPGWARGAMPWMPSCGPWPTRPPGDRRLRPGGAGPPGRPAGARRAFGGGLGHRPDPARGGVRTHRVRPLRRARSWRPRRAAQESGAVIVLKGPGTVVAAPGVTYVDTFGDASLATAGSGDVLAGLIAGMLARCRPVRRRGSAERPPSSRPAPSACTASRAAWRAPRAVR